MHAPRWNSSVCLLALGMACLRLSTSKCNARPTPALRRKALRVQRAESWPHHGPWEVDYHDRQMLESAWPKDVPRGGAFTATRGHPAATSSARHTVRVLGCFGLWYILNVWYNIVNKRALIALPLPMSVAILQLGIGSLWVCCQWALGIRPWPEMPSSEGMRRLTPVAFFHGGGQLATVISLGAGMVSFTHVVKAMEPFFSALVAAVCFQQVFRLQVYAALLPVVAGVSLACYTGEDELLIAQHRRSTR